MAMANPTEPLSELSSLVRDSRRVRAGTSPTVPLRRRNEPVSNDERSAALDDDELLRAARHNAELKLARSRGQQEGYNKGLRSASVSHFCSGTAFGILLCSAVVYFAVRLGWWL